LRISTEVKWLVLFAGNAAIGIVRPADQVFDLFQRHADLQLVEFAARGWSTDDFAFDQTVSRLHYPFVCICSGRGGFIRCRAAKQENQANGRYYQVTAVHNV
jgi:hypothetical protein